MYKLSSKRRRGPVAPIITNGCPASRANTIPAKEVDMRVSEIPTKFSVLSAAQSEKKN